MNTKKYRKTKTKLNIGGYNAWIVLVAIVLLALVGLVPQVRSLFSQSAPAASYTITPSFAHLHPGESKKFTCKTPTGSVCTNLTWYAKSAAGTIDQTGKFTASSTLGTYSDAVWAQGNPGYPQWWSNHAKVVIANNFYPIELERIGTDGSKFIFEPITLGWSPNPGTQSAGVMYKIIYKHGWTGTPTPVLVGNITSYELPSSTIEYFADGDWFWTVSAIIDGVTYDRPSPQYNTSLKISKHSATNFTYPNPDQCAQGVVKIHQPQQVFSWNEVTDAARYAIKIGIGNKSGPYWYTVSLTDAPSIMIIKSLYNMLPNDTYLYLSISGTALPGSQSINNLNYKDLSYGTVCRVYVDKD